PTPSPLFPYTTLFRSLSGALARGLLDLHAQRRRAADAGNVDCDAHLLRGALEVDAELAVRAGIAVLVDGEDRAAEVRHAADGDAQDALAVAGRAQLGPMHAERREWVGGRLRPRARGNFDDGRRRGARRRRRSG